MKRGQGLGVNTIVLAALALIVLVILIFVFRTQIQKGTQKYLEIGEKAETEARGENLCETLVSGRVCLQECPKPQFFKVPGKWNDCKGDKPDCCERT